jgi:tetratricopeptide (TPR) repeat protein
LKPDTKHFVNLFLEYISKTSEKYTKKAPVFLICMALIVTTFAVYIQAGSHQFLTLDDDVYVTNNPHVTSGITSENITWAFTAVDTETGNWHPITWLSHMADARFFGMNPRGPHLTNVVIHTVSSLILLLLLRRCTGSLWQSSFVAALFALHPLHVESVAWVAERKDVLSALFWFLTLIFYTEYVARQKRSLYLLTFFSFMLGLMCKPMLVTLPIIMLLMDFWPLDRYRNEELGHGCKLSGRIKVLFKEKTIFFICSFLSGIVTIYAQHMGTAMSDLNEVPLGLRIANALISYIKYIEKTFWPHNLAVLYPLPSSIPLWQATISLLVLLLLSAAAICTWRRHPYLAVGWFWFLVALVPVIGLIQVGGQSMADRYSYIPLIGLFIMVAWGVPELTKGLQHQKGILALLACMVIIASAALTWQQLGYWRDSISLYKHTLKVTTSNYGIHTNLGLAFAGKGEFGEAIQEYQEAIRINPNDAKAHYAMGIAFANKGELDATIHNFQEAIRINPNDAKVHYALGLAFANKGEFDAAIQDFQEAIRINPNDANVHINLGAAFAGKGDLDAAIQEFQETIRINPDDTKAYTNLEIALVQKRMQDEARK